MRWAAAQAPLPPGPHALVAQHGGKCLDVLGESQAEAAPVVQWTCHGAANQQWILESAGDGFVRLVARHSGKVLEVAGASLADRAEVRQATPGAAASQQWRLEPDGDGVYRLIARHSGKVLDVADVSTADGAAVIQYAVNGGANQRWLLRPIDSQAAPAAADVVRFLEQASWGPTPDLVAHVQRIGFEQWLREQATAPASGYPTLPLHPSTRDSAACPDNSTCQRDNYTFYLPQARFFVNALYGGDQLRQRMAFALHQILVVSGVEVRLPAWITPYLQLLDRHALGSFRDLLRDITLNPAMGSYLDVANNTRANPNENYAREILQLFAVGTVKLNRDGTPQLDDAGQPIPAYSQTTIDNFARVFTGWRFAAAPAAGVPNYLEPMVANDAQHDTQPKTLLRGEALAAGQGAAADLEAAIDNIVNDPNVAPFISRQLIQHLVTSNPSPAYVARVAAVFDDNGTGARGDLGAVARAILLDEEARGDVKTAPAYGRLRHPVQFVLNLLRAFTARSADGSGPSDGYLAPQLTPMGMDLFRPPSVFSYFPPSAVVAGTAGLRGPEFAILSTSTALRRANFVNTMAFSRIAVGANAPSGTSLDLAPLQALARDPESLVAALDRLLLHGAMPVAMRQAVVAAVSAVPVSNTLKRARTGVYLVATSAAYQVQR